MPFEVGCAEYICASHAYFISLSPITRLHIAEIVVGNGIVIAMIIFVHALYLPFARHQEDVELMAEIS